MQDQPRPDEILAAIAAFLRDTVMAKTDPHTAYQARVAANAVDLVRRQLELGVPGEDAELERLQTLLGHSGTLQGINRTILVTGLRSRPPPVRLRDMDFSLPADLIEYLAELDRFIELKIKPLQAQDDNQRFFD